MTIGAGGNAMSKKNTSLPLPLQLVKDYDSSFKGCWEMAEYMREGKGKHWHHYWTGSRSDNSRKLILKWTAPTFVGSADDTITTIQKLK